jgi:hypothetical protein
MSRIHNALGFGFIALLSGCAGGRIEVSVASSELNGAPVQGSLFVTVTRVDVHVAGQGQDDRDIDENGFISVFEGEARVNLSDLAATREILGASAVPAGKVTQVRLILADDAVIDDGAGNLTPVSCSSCNETGLKLNPSGKLEVPEGGTLDLVLDFDVNTSLSATGSGFRLDPVIKLELAAEEAPEEGL